LSAAVRQTLPGGFDSACFMAEYWQRKPLPLRSAFSFAAPPIDRDELAGLACKEEVNSRIVQEHHADGPWHLDYGPFDADHFAALPATHWTLLVSDVEKHLPELRFLLEPFRFIPDWRIDDLMISYAVDGGSVGPHTDDYDVFLIQLEGVREWQISTRVDHDDIIDGIDLRILKHFEPEQTWRLEPGDMLYLPPRIAHHGIARGDCMTASVGFRAPSHREILQDYLDEIILRIPEDLRYGDAGSPPLPHPGEIPARAVTRFRRIITEHITLDDAAFSDWLGRYLSEPKGEPPLPAEPALEAGAFRAALAAGQRIIRNPHSRFAWHDNGETVTLFVDRQSWTLPRRLLPDVQRLTDAFEIPGDQFSAEFLDTLHRLYRHDAIWLDEDD